ncbi:MAG: HisA/HisF-related TIM barrel protein [Isosphaeraceae bacterium]|nr:HisA/HisF-related TIM barrel protein [Isosphaeraceae bacterium]
MVPVLDLKQGQAVHAVGGDRAHYRPVESRLHPGSDPVGIARAFSERLGLRTLYLADLDAIAGARPSFGTYGALRDLGVEVWLDAGLRTAADLGALVGTGVSTLVVGSETLRCPAILDKVLAKMGPERVVFSLDLKAGQPLLAAGADWGLPEPWAVAMRALGHGAQRLLLLDLARVGTGTGVGTLALARELSSQFPVEIAVGGGIARAEEIKDAAHAGVSAVLLGSALHSGAIEIERGRVVG